MVGEAYLPQIRYERKVKAPVPTIKVRRSFQKKMQELVHEYMRIHDVVEVELEQVARWAVDTGRYQRQPQGIVQQCKRELGQAVRAEYYTDPQGRDVRKMHPVRVKDPDGEQMVIWADIQFAKPNHMRVSFQQRRLGILADCKQHKTDVDSYNDNNEYHVQLLFDYDFNTDLEEGSLPTDYPNGPDDED